MKGRKLPHDRLALYAARREVDADKVKEKAKRARGLHPAFKDKCDTEDACRCCGRPRSLSSKLERHHIVHRSSLMGLPQAVRDHPDNGMALCRDCHVKHHRNEDSFTRAMLSGSELAFILLYQGEGWLEKHFPVKRKEKPDERRVRGGRGWATATDLGSRAAAEAASRRCDAHRQEANEAGGDSDERQGSQEGSGDD